MEKIGDYIPLIIIAISLVYSFAKGIKKSAKEDTEKTMPFFNSPEILQKDMSNPQIKPRPQYQPKKEAFNPEVERTVLPIQTEEISDENRLDIDFSDSEELKKGIIFAEIFNRKY